MMDRYQQEYLKHYGVLGMRWGTRRRRVTTSNSSRSSSNQNGPRQRRMSNKELKSRVTRMKLEQDYKKLLAESQPKTISKVDKLVKNADTIAKLSGSALTLYKNLDELGVLKKKPKIVK